MTGLFVNLFLIKMAKQEEPHKIKNWGLQEYEIKSCSIRYTAPELFDRYKLLGQVISHPNFENNEQILTSIIETIDNRIITTISGSKYELIGEPLEEFKQCYIRTYGSYDNEKPLFPSYNSQRR